MDGTDRVVVATNAFGMGIDKPDVRLVVHYNTPSTIEDYYQEAGRAGRDRGDADCVLIHAYADRFTHEFLLGQAHPDRRTTEAVARVLPWPPTPISRAGEPGWRGRPQGTAGRGPPPWRPVPPGRAGRRRGGAARCGAPAPRGQWRHRTGGPRHHRCLGPGDRVGEPNPGCARRRCHRQGARRGHPGRRRPGPGPSMGAHARRRPASCPLRLGPIAGHGPAPDARRGGLEAQGHRRSLPPAPPVPTARPRDRLGSREAEAPADDLEKLRRHAGVRVSARMPRRYLLQYFGESAPWHCGRCDRCLPEQRRILPGWPAPRRSLSRH
jgi:hypothetical protein